MIIHFSLAMKTEGTLLIKFLSEWPSRNGIFCISNFAAQEKEASSADFHKSSLQTTLLIINYQKVEGGDSAPLLCSG